MSIWHIGSEIKAGDLGGFVECESNLSFEPGDDTYLRGTKLSRCARVSRNGIVLQSPNTKASPILCGNCAVYGGVMGDVMLAGTVVVVSISNESMILPILANPVSERWARTCGCSFPSLVL